MLKLFTGNINQAIQSIKADVLLNLTDPRGSGIHPLSNVLFRDFPEYNEMLTQVKYMADRRQLPGKYMFRVVDDVVHILGFVDNLMSSFTQMNTPCENPPLINLLRSINSDMMKGNQRSIILPYYGLKASGYHFLDYLFLLEQCFDESITVYISVSEQYTTRTELDVLRFSSPTPDNGKRTIYQTKEVGGSAFEVLKGYSPDTERRRNYRTDRNLINRFFPQSRQPSYL